jgi:hypothetical protein
MHKKVRPGCPPSCQGHCFSGGYGRRRTRLPGRRHARCGESLAMEHQRHRRPSCIRVCHKLRRRCCKWESRSKRTGNAAREVAPSQAWSHMIVSFRTEVALPVKLCTQAATCSASSEVTLKLAGLLYGRRVVYHGACSVQRHVRLGQDQCRDVLESRTVRVSAGYRMPQRMSCQRKNVISLGAANHYTAQKYEI